MIIGCHVLVMILPETEFNAATLTGCNHKVILGYLIDKKNSAQWHGISLVQWCAIHLLIYNREKLCKYQGSKYDTSLANLIRCDGGRRRKRFGWLDTYNSSGQWSGTCALTNWAKHLTKQITCSQLLFVCTVFTWKKFIRKFGHKDNFNLILRDGNILKHNMFNDDIQ